MDPRPKSTGSSIAFANVPWRSNNEIETAAAHQLAKLSVYDAKPATKSKTDASPEARKVLKRYKVENMDTGCSGRPTNFEKNSSSVEDKKNK